MLAETDKAGRSFLSVEVRNRKLRLFACACCRAVWESLNESERGIVSDAEEYADGGKHKRREYSDSVQLGVLAALMSEPISAANGGIWLLRGTSPAAQAVLLREIVGNPFRPVGPLRRVVRSAALMSAAALESGASEEVIWESPWLTPTVVALAENAYDERPGRKCGRCGGTGDENHGKLYAAFKRCPDCRGTGCVEDGALDPDRLAVLADALEDVGCTDAEILNHLRGRDTCPECLGSARHVAEPVHPKDCRCGMTGWVPLRGPHVRGCWALDLLLGKE